MAEVTLNIGGRSYTVHCGDGEETHLRTLANRIDAKMTSARQAAPGLTEVRQLLFAAILLADEVHDLSRQPQRQASLGLEPPAADKDDDQIVVARLNALAERMESLGIALAEAADAP